MKIHQNYIALLMAAGLAVLVLLINMVTQAPDGMLRMGYAAALYLISRDTLAWASIAKGPRRFNNPDRWILAFYLALFFGTFMLLAMWRGMAHMPTLLVGVTIGAVLYGGLMAFFVADKPFPYAHHFKSDNPKSQNPVRRFFYYASPLINLFLIWVLVQNATQDTAHLFFFIILLGFMSPRYPRKPIGNFIWTYLPMIMGYLMLAGLLLMFG